MTNEQLSIVIGFLVVCGTGLSAMFGKFALWVSKRITDCESDRSSLWLKIETDRSSYSDKVEVLYAKISALSEQVGRMEGHLEHIDDRNLKIDDQSVKK